MGDRGVRASRRRRRRYRRDDGAGLGGNWRRGANRGYLYLAVGELRCGRESGIGIGNCSNGGTGSGMALKLSYC